MYVHITPMLSFQAKVVNIDNYVYTYERIYYIHKSKQRNKQTDLHFVFVLVVCNYAHRYMTECIYMHIQM